MAEGKEEDAPLFYQSPSAGGSRRPLIIPAAASPLFQRLFGAPEPLQQTPLPPPPPSPPAKTLGVLGLALFCFASIAGGPYGIENSVGAIGPLPTMLALLFASIAWSLAQALMAAELSSMFPSNAGSILWCLKGLGPTWGFVNAWLGFCMNVLNLPLYTVLAAKAVGQVLELSSSQEFGLQLGVLLLGVVVNIFGLAVVERLTGLLVVLVQVPFVLMPIVWAAQGRAFEWRVLTRSQEGWVQQLGPGLATVCWNSLGWNSLGNVAGEVKDPSRNIPLGFLVANVAISLNYLVPLALTLPMAPDLDAWGTGYFVAIAQSTAPWLGTLAAVCGVLSCVNNLIPQLAMAARATQATVKAGMFPSALAFFGRSSALTGTPVAAILLNATCSLCLVRLDFDVLVVLEILCALVCLVLQFAAFLVLKHRQPNAPRPFAVPGGLVGAYVISVPFFLLALMLIWFDVQGNAYTLSVLAVCLLSFLLGRFSYAADVYTAEVLEVLLADDGAGGGSSGSGRGDGRGGGLGREGSSSSSSSSSSKSSVHSQPPLPLEATLLLHSDSGAC